MATEFSGVEAAKITQMWQIPESKKKKKKIRSKSYTVPKGGAPSPPVLGLLKLWTCFNVGQTSSCFQKNDAAGDEFYLLLGVMAFLLRLLVKGHGAVIG